MTTTEAVRPAIRAWDQGIGVGHMAKTTKPSRQKSYCITGDPAAAEAVPVTWGA
jgi:hypothetical protein